SAADAEDATQDAFVKAWRALGRFRPDAPFRPWVLRIVANEARNRRRSAGRRVRLSLRAEAEGSSGGAAPSPEASVVAAGERPRPRPTWRRASPRGSSRAGAGSRSAASR